MRLTVAYISGRPLLAAVVDMLAGRVRALGWHRRLDLRLLVIWDRVAAGSPAPAAALQRAAAGLFSAVRCLEAGGAAGFAQLRNRALDEALADDADVLLFLDDDEYYTAPWRDDGGRLRWHPADPIGPHLAGLASGAQLTNGYTLGEPSPIPRGLPARVDDALLRRLGRALAPGSEFLHETALLHGRVCLAPGPQPPPRRRIPVRDGLRRLSGGNLALDLAAARAGRLPPFFAPAHARGEDALFGARIGDLQVLRVPAFVFHDPFRRHVDIPAGARPPQLRPTAATADAVERFGRALLGWVRYAPLLLRLRRGVDAEAALDDLHEALSVVAPALARGLGWEGFAVAPVALARARRSAAADLARMRSQERAWRHGCRRDPPTVVAARAA